jgi:hypothetical protein
VDPEPRTDEPPVTLASVRRSHPGWQIALENGVYVAVNRPAQTSQHIVVFPALEDLCERLGQIDGPWQPSHGDHGSDRGARSCFR